MAACSIFALVSSALSTRQARSMGVCTSPSPVSFTSPADNNPRSKDFTLTKVASEATLYLKTEPGLLDRFITDLRDISTEKRDEAYLEAI